jgi:excinuclease UvrABC nuclease subunit
MSISIDALKKQGFGQLPDTPGVYFFLGTPEFVETQDFSSRNRNGSKCETQNLASLPSRNILYIGKATSLRDRVRSYFSVDIARARGPKIVAMLERASAVRVQPTDSVLEALLLESQLIKQHQPPYNTDEKDDKSFLYAVITKEKFPRVLLKRGRDIERNRHPESAAVDEGSQSVGTHVQKDGILRFAQNDKPKYIFGPFPSGGSLKEALKIVRRIFPFRDTCLPAEALAKVGVLCVETQNVASRVKPKHNPETQDVASLRNTSKPCFNAQIGLCPGVCTGAVSAAEYAKTIRNIKLFFEGKKSVLVRQLQKDMKEAIRVQAFERANEIKKTLFALGHIKDVSLLKREVVNDFQTSPQPSPYPMRGGNPTTSFRIEAYDAAHLAGQEVVGVMTVVEDGRVNKQEYRKFHIRGGTGNDLASLEQMLRRRLRHTEWRLPDLIAVDGFDLQIGVAQTVLSELGLFIPVVGVVKDAHHQPKDILGDPALAKHYKDSILLANSEAHRFAITFHRHERAKKFLGK